MKYTSLLTATLIGATLFTTSCIDDFADINTNPSTVSKGELSYLFAQGVHDFEPADYTFWFYNGKYYAQFIQAFVPTGGNTELYNRMDQTGGQGSQNYSVLKIAREMDKVMNDLGPEEAAKYQYVRTLLDPLIVYLGMFDTDGYGDMPFSEACMAPYTNPMLLTPKYDTVQEMYTNWLDMLNKTIDILTTTPAVAQTFPGSQDMVYAGDIAKWAKLANSLKLKIAVRLLSQDKAKAIAIAEEVAKSPAGVLSGTDDDFIFNKGITDYHFNPGNTVSFGAPKKEVADFLIKNEDPRVRFFYTKNHFNSKVVQAFYDAGKDVPAYIEANVNSEMENGKKVFKSWKGAGEPWVRYYGIPADIGAANQTAKYGDYFDENRYKLVGASAEKTFTPYSIFQQENCHGNVTYTVPVVPDGPVIQDKENHAWYGFYMTSGEVYLYLAEFKLLGANLPSSAQDYFSKGVEYSVKSYDRWAGLNQIPYYGTTYGYDPNEVSIELKDGEIETMLANPDYQLTGSREEQLEKVYIQEYIHFMYQPSDQFVAVRRSGIPKVNSTLIPWQLLGPNTEVPRRLEIGIPSKTDKMYEIKIASLKSQNFTGGTSLEPSILNRERVWQDAGAPNYGEGPNY